MFLAPSLYNGGCPCSARDPPTHSDYPFSQRRPRQASAISRRRKLGQSDCIDDLYASLAAQCPLPGGMALHLRKAATSTLSHVQPIAFRAHRYGDHGPCTPFPFGRRTYQFPIVSRSGATKIRAPRVSHQGRSTGTNRPMTERGSCILQVIHTTPQPQQP